jgi:hypothetical protein
MKDNNLERGDSYLGGLKNEGRRWRRFGLEDFLDDGLQDDSEGENCDEERHLECSPENK